MFDNRWDNWSGDFAESFASESFGPAVRPAVPAILAHFGAEARRLDPAWPDEVSAGTFAAVLHQSMPRLKLPEHARREAPEVVARFLEYLRESGRVAEGEEWAAEVRRVAAAGPSAVKAEPRAKVEPIRNSDKVRSVGRNDPCPCGSGKKFKKCCMAAG